MSRLAAILEVLRSTCATIETLDPGEQDIAYRALLDEVRSRRPESVGFLGNLPAPTEPIRDPRVRR